MPIAKYFQNLLGPPPLPPEPELLGFGGGCYFPLNEDGTPVQGESIDSFERRIIAWELGQDAFIPGQPVTFNQFTFHAYDEAYDKYNPMHEAIEAIRMQDEIRKKERVLQFVKSSVVIGGVSYTVWKLLIFFL